MFSAVVGWFSQDLALDLGTSNTRLFFPDHSTPSIAPTVVAIQSSTAGQRSLLAVGEEAQVMLGRTPQDIDAIQPVRHGKIEDFEVTEALIIHLLRQAHGRNRWMSPRMVVTLPPQTNDMERHAIRKCCESAGAREVHLIPSPIAAALGAGLPVEEPAGQMIVDIGGGSTTISVVSLNRVVHAFRVPGGGEGMDRQIISFIQKKYGLLVGTATAELVKRTIGAAAPEAMPKEMLVKGRCMKTGLPKGLKITSDEVHTALLPTLQTIAKAMLQVLEASPTELASDIVDHGVIMVGGGSQLRGLDACLRTATSLSVFVAESPELSAVIGAKKVMESTDLIEATCL